MRLLAVIICGLIGVAAIAAPARAETISTHDALPRSALFMGYLQSSARHQLVIDFIGAMDRQYGQACNQPHAIRILTVLVVRPVVINPGKPAPENGAWSEKLSAQRCGRTSVVNILFIAGQGPMPKPVELIPGMTAALPELMRDAFPMASAGAMGVAEKQKPGSRNCKQVRVTDTSAPTITGDKRAESNGTVGRAWFETWTFDVCGTPAAVRVNFWENLTTGGTNFAVSL